MAWLGLTRSLGASALRVRVAAVSSMTSTPLAVSVPRSPLSAPALARSFTSLTKVPVSSAALPIALQVRSYARLSRGRTRVDVDEKTETTTDTNTLAEHREKKEDRYQEYDREPPADESQESAITPDTRRFLTKVYGTMMAGMGFAAAGAVAGGLAPGLALAGMIGSFVGIIGLMFVGRERVTLRQNLFLGITAMLGMGIGPLLAVTAPGVTFAAALGTSAIFGGFTLAALRAKRKSMLMLGGPLMGGMLLLLAVSLSSILLPMVGVTSPAILGALYNLNLYGGLGIFSLFIAFDTQNMIEQYKMGDDDHVSPALNMFLNVFNIFIRLIQIFRGD